MRQPLVTIVGRPNVGKSTLFNRIIKRRDAIVHNNPGVTRDRHFADTDWNGKVFTLVDTGGYLPQSKDLIERAIREQVEIALTEADVVLYVVDRTTGIADIDLQIADKLQKTKKTVLTLVNKIDHEGLEGESYQFYSLGLGEPIMVSAAHGRGIGDMLDLLVHSLGKIAVEQKDEENAVKLAVIGKENVGKSSFVNTLIGKERVIVTPIPGTTRDPIDTPLKYNKKNFLLIDTAGLKKKAKIQENILFYSHLRTLRSVRRADVVIYFIDSVKGLTRQDLNSIQDTIDARKAILIAVNKWDLIEKNQNTAREWEIDIRERLGSFNHIPIIFISVYEKKRLYKLLDLVTVIDEEQKKKIQTSELNKVLLPVIKNNSPPATAGKEIKINYITQLKTSPPLFAFFCNHPKLIPINYRRFLEKQIRGNWGFKGVPVNLVFKSKRKGN